VGGLHLRGSGGVAPRSAQIGGSPRLRPLGRYRLKKARELFLKNAYSEGAVQDYYRNWRADTNFMLGEKWTFPKNKAGKRITQRERVSWKLPKRGDELYKHYLKKKLQWIEDLPGESLFNPTDRSKTIQQTNFLFVTWTTHVLDKFYSNREKHDIWKEDSEICNRTLTRLRQHYGRVWYWRSNEGTKKGFPAPHGVLVFPDHVWNVRMMKSRKGKNKGKQTWRVFGEQHAELKSILEGKDKRASPVQGFTDIQGLHNPRGALKHISKYCFGAWVELDGSLSRKAEIQELTYFWLWITRKHTYSSSRGFDINIQNLLKVSSDLTRTQLAISKDQVWVYLRVGSPEEAEAWDLGPEDLRAGPGPPGRAPPGGRPRGLTPFSRPL